MFTEVPGNVVILQCGGVFYQKPIYRCTQNNRVFAKWGAGYIRLGTADSTSAPKVQVVGGEHAYREAHDVTIRDKFKGPGFV